MFLDSLKYFTWYNEPENVRFVEEGMVVEAAAQTDFWQNNTHNVRKDNGHMFYSEMDGNFTLIVKWWTLEPVPYSQFGLMIRLDSMNWAKISFLSPDAANPQVGCIITNNGNSDWSIAYLEEYHDEMWYKLVRRGEDFLFYYSIDGQRYRQVRLFNLNQLAMRTVKIGAYACSPQNFSARAVLEDVNIK